jgi:hypothetical protein
MYHKFSKKIEHVSWERMRGNMESQPTLSDIMALSSPFMEFVMLSAIKSLNQKSQFRQAMRRYETYTFHN